HALLRSVPGCGRALTLMGPMWPDDSLTLIGTERCPHTFTLDSRPQCSILRPRAVTINVHGSERNPDAPTQHVHVFDGLVYSFPFSASGEMTEILLYNTKGSL